MNLPVTNTTPQKADKRRANRKNSSIDLILENDDAFFQLSPRKKNEMLGVLYITFAILIFTGLIFEKSGFVRRFVLNFVQINGAGPLFLAFFALYCGLRRLYGHITLDRSTQILAFPFVYFSLIGFVSAVSSQWEGIFFGGVVGNYIFWHLEIILGRYSTIIILLSIFVTGLMHVTDIYVSDILRFCVKSAQLGWKHTVSFTCLMWAVLSSSSWWCIKKTHTFFYVLISDLIQIAERGANAFIGLLLSHKSEKENADDETAEVNEKEAVAIKELRDANSTETKTENTEKPPIRNGNKADEFIIRPQQQRSTVKQAPLKTAEKPLPPNDNNRNIKTAEKEIPTVQNGEKQRFLPAIIAPEKNGHETKPKRPKEEEIIVELEKEEMRDLKDIDQSLNTTEQNQSHYTEDDCEYTDEYTEDDSEVEEYNHIEAQIPEEEEIIPKDLPDFDFLTIPPENLEADTEDELWERGGKLIKALDTYKVRAILDSFVQGPTITRFELKPAAGTKLNKIVGLTNEIAMALASKSVRIEAPIPGTSKVGIEIPNAFPVPVYFREIISAIKDGETRHPLVIAFGKDISGEPVIGNLAKMPHLLVAGSTGSGKSVCINTIISSILFCATPEQVKFVMIDPKQVELAVYRNIPHLITDVVTNPEEAAAALQWGVAEMENRYSLLSNFGVRHIDSFNKKLLEGSLEPITEIEHMPTETLPYVVIIIDELADLMMVAKKEVETSICRIAQKARAVGIHLVVATQRPSVDVITGLIKANLPSRIAFMVNSGIDSKTILNQIGAENLLGKGDMLFFPAGQPKPDRIQGAFVSDDEVAHLVKTVRSIFGDADYEDIVSSFLVTEEPADDGGEEFYDDKYNMALEVAVKEQYVSTSMLQRHLGLGYNRAARIVDVMFARGVCGSQESGKKRKVLIRADEMENYTI
jgi:S-DNA-T family DNA segregation ATPase FtsK/SpoIIIE